MSNDAFVSLLSSILGIVIGALLNHFLSRKKIEAEIEKFKAEAEQAKTESEKIKAEMAKQANEPKIVISGLLPELENSDAYYSRAKKYDAAKDYNQAIDDFSQAIRLDPKNALYYIARGQSYFNKGYWKECSNDESQAIKLEPQNAYYYSLRGNTYRFSKKYDLAIADYTKAIELDPKRDDSYYGRAYCLFEKYVGNFESDICEAISLSPQDEYFLLRGRINFHKGRNCKNQFSSALEYLESAISDFSNALSFSDGNLAYWWRGRTYYEKDDFKSAIADFSTAIHIDPDDSSNYYWRGLSYKAQSRFNLKNRLLARKDFKKAIELGNGDALNEL